MEKIAEEQRRRTRERKHNGESLQKPDVASAEAAATTEDNDGDVGGGGR
jgi:hypothetical protein